MAIQITNYGMAMLDLNAGVLPLDLVKLGSAYNYVPLATDTDIHGTEVYSMAPTSSSAVNANVVKYSAYIDHTAASFDFGEIGLFYNNQLFALGAFSTLVSKLQLNGSSVGNSIRIDIYLSVVGTNYNMWFDLAESNNSFKMATLQSPDMLPPSYNATPNVYIIQGADSNQGPVLAFTDRTGLWNFDAYQYATLTRGTILSATNTSVTLDIAGYSSSMLPEYFGAIILEFVTGELFSICRYVKTVTVSGTTATLSFDTQLMKTPAVGDKFQTFRRSTSATSASTMPVATRETLGAVKIGNGLSIDVNGNLYVDAITLGTVTSVNTMKGDVTIDANNLPGLSQVGKTGDYNHLTNKPAAYSLPAGSPSVRGGFRLGLSGNLQVTTGDVLDFSFVPVKTVNNVQPDAAGNIDTLTALDGLVSPTALTASIDLNTLVTRSGLYYGSESTTIVNKPLGASSKGVLEVIRNGTNAAVLQRWTGDGVEQTRSLVGGVWSDWRPSTIGLIQRSDLPSAIPDGADLNSYNKAGLYYFSAVIVPPEPGSSVFEAYTYPTIAVQWEGTQPELLSNTPTQLMFRVTSLIAAPQLVTMKPATGEDSLIAGANVPYGFSFGPFNYSSYTPTPTEAVFTEFNLDAGESKVVYVLLNPSPTMPADNVVITFDSQSPDLTLTLPYVTSDTYSSFRILQMNAMVGSNHSLTTSDLEGWSQNRVYTYSGASGPDNPNIVYVNLDGFMDTIEVVVGLNYVPADPNVELELFKDGVSEAVWTETAAGTLQKYSVTISPSVAYDLALGDGIYEHTFKVRVGLEYTPDFVFALRFTQIAIAG